MPAAGIESGAGRPPASTAASESGSPPSSSPSAALPPAIKDYTHYIYAPLYTGAAR
jgi:hypothetical protein